MLNRSNRECVIADDSILLRIGNDICLGRSDSTRCASVPANPYVKGPHPAVKAVKPMLRTESLGV